MAMEWINVLYNKQKNTKLTQPAWTLTLNDSYPNPDHCNKLYL